MTLADDYFDAHSTDREKANLARIRGQEPDTFDVPDSAYDDDQGDGPGHVPALSDLPEPIDWATFWDRPPATCEWEAEPLLPKGRQIAIYAPAKAGKSLLALEIGAARATGRAVLGQPAGDPISVCYFDFEMVLDDLHERLTDLGYTADDDLSNLHYFSIPLLPGLDTDAGGAIVDELVALHRPALVIFDTFGRAVEGPEDEADTVRGFVRHTGRRLRAAGLTVLRLDHAGKDVTKGQRGSSAKADDVDLVWRLTAEGNAITLKATHSRLAWVPDEVHLHRHTEPRLEHRIAPRGFLAGTSDCAAAMDRLDVPIDATVAGALAALRAAGEGKRTAIVSDALRSRRERPSR